MRRNDRQSRKSEVRHGARHCPNVERIARGYKDDFDAVGLRFYRQETIVV
jgi:hypothetical protein